jgi:hypothetical protein
MLNSETGTPPENMEAAPYEVSELQDALAPPLDEEGSQGTDPSAEQTETTDEGAEVSAGDQPEGHPPTADDETLEVADGAEGETQEESLSYDRLLPLEQFEKNESIPERILKAAAQRWKIPEEDLSKPWVEPFLRDKLNTDIYLKNEKFDRELAELEDQPREEAKADEGNPPLPEQMAQILDGMDNMVSPLITDEGAKAFSDSIGASWAKLQEAQESGDETKILAAQRDLTRNHMRWMALAANVIMAQNLPNHLESINSRQSQIQEMHHKALVSLSEDPRYSDTLQLAESGDLDKVFGENPELLQKQFRDKAGNPLSPAANFREQVRRAITIIRGENYKPAQELVNEATETGKRLASEEEKKRNLGKLGKGRSTGAFSQKGSSEEYIGNLVDAYDRNNPLG